MEKTIAKMLRHDVLVVVGFVVFLWFTMGFMAYAILHALGASSTKNILITIGIITLLFATLSLAALIQHLRKHSAEIYAEELQNADPETASVADEAPAEPVLEQSTKHVSNAFVKVFDIVFIMILCFATLLASMLLNPKTLTNTPINAALLKKIYTLDICSAVLIAVGFIIYFIYLLRHSHRELKNMIEELYAREENGGTE